MLQAVATVRAGHMWSSHLCAVAGAVSCVTTLFDVPSRFGDCAPVAEQPQGLWDVPCPGRQSCSEQDLPEQAVTPRSHAVHPRQWERQVMLCSRQTLWVFGPCFVPLDKPADPCRNGQEQSQEAQRKPRSDLCVLLLLSLRTSLKFRALPGLCLASSGYKEPEQASPQWYLSFGVSFSLIFLKPNLDRLDFFDLMWIVGIADFVLKYLTIALKCLVVALPKIILAVKSKVGDSS